MSTTLVRNFVMPRYISFVASTGLMLASAHAAPVSADAPLNAAMVVDAGAFGAKDTMEIPLSIQTYGAGTIAR